MLYEYTGNGYFLTISHPELPSDYVILSTPAVLGVAKDIQCGFLVFLGDQKLTLECHTWGTLDLPTEFRDELVELSLLAATSIDALTLQSGLPDRL